MTQPIAYLQGQFVPAAEAAVPVTDAGFVVGATVAEQLRTFRGRLFRLDEHLNRLRHSLEIVGIEPGLDKRALADLAERVVEHNHALLAPGDDLGLSIFVTPGRYGTFDESAESEPLVGMHTYRLPFHLWCDKYDHGQSLVISGVTQSPADCWPRELKCRSRIHYYLADRQARQREPGSRALLLDQDGKVTEASTASVVIFRADEGLVAPPADKILPGISLHVVQELAAKLGISFSHRDLLPRDVAQADEVLLCSTSPCLLPVMRLDGQPIGRGQPGEVFQRLLQAWNEMVGLDIRAQAIRFARR